MRGRFVFARAPFGVGAFEVSTARQTKPERALGRYVVVLERIERVTVPIEAWESSRAIEGALHLAESGQIAATAPEWRVVGCEEEE